MEEIKLKIAIISDLHCHPKRKDYDKNRTLLFSDKLRSPSKEHPVQNLIEIFEEEDSLAVDLVLCPGDYTDGSDQQGFLSGWSYVKELAYALKCPEIIGTLGNHDIDSRNLKSNYSFEIAKKIRQDFPIKKQNIGKFWEDGYTFIESDILQILVLNSAHYHTHSGGEQQDNPVVKGKIDKGEIEKIEKYLKSNNNDDKIKILLCHHHPVQHSRNDLGDFDFIENGEELVNLLGEFKFDLIIHGHKHDPWLRYFTTECGYQIPILSSGSFSATSQLSWINKFNYLHFIEITKLNKVSKGKVETWSFQNKVGWKKNVNIGFYPFTGFGNLNDLNQLASEIENFLSKSEMMVEWSDIIQNFSEIENLTPDKIDQLQHLLKTKNVHTNPDIGLKPKHIYKVS